MQAMSANFLALPAASRHRQNMRITGLCRVATSAAIWSALHAAAHPAGVDGVLSRYDRPWVQFDLVWTAALVAGGRSVLLARAQRRSGSRVEGRLARERPSHCDRLEARPDLFPGRSDVCIGQAILGERSADTSRGGSLAVASASSCHCPCSVARSAMSCCTMRDVGMSGVGTAASAPWCTVCRRKRGGWRRACGVAYLLARLATAPGCAGGCAPTPRLRWWFPAGWMARPRRRRSPPPTGPEAQVADMRSSISLRGPDPAPLDVIVDQPHRLHERIDGRRPDEAPAALAQLLAEGGRLRALGDGAQGRPVEPGRSRRRGVGRTKAWSEPASARRSMTRRALLRADSILPRWRTMPASARSRVTSSGPKRHSVSASKSAKARRKFSRLRRMVSQDRPDWKPSRQSFSNR